MNTTTLETLSNLLQAEHADFTIDTHNTTFKTAASGAAYYGISIAETTPTLILETPNGYLAAIICGNTQISFKKLKQALQVKDVSLADPATVLTVTGSKIGEISLINVGLATLIDTQVLKNNNCYGGCGVPKATLRINTQDLLRITNAQILDFTDERS